MTDKMIQLIERIAAKNQSELPWERTHNHGEFQVAFPQYVVRVLLNRSGDVALRLLNQEGELMEEVTYRKYADSPSIDGAKVLHWLRDIYDGARRKSLGLDQAIDNILESLR